MRFFLRPALCFLSICLLPFGRAHAQQEGSSSWWATLKQLRSEELYPALIMAATPAAIAGVRVISYATERLGLGATMLLGQITALLAYHQYKKYFPTPSSAPTQSTTMIGYFIINEPLLETEKFHEALGSCLKDANIKGIIIKIDASGGDLGACQALFHEIKKATAAKPIIVMIEKQCCQEAYLVASAANLIIAHEQALIGKIGTLVTLNKQASPDQQQLLFYAGSLTALDHPGHTLTGTEKQAVAKQVEMSYQQLCRDIATQRKISSDTSAEWADGKVFMGSQALSLHLIDRLGSLTDALDGMALLLKERGLSCGTLVRVPFTIS